MAPADGGRQAQDAVAGEPGGGDPDGRDEAVRSRPRCDRHHGAAEGGDVPDRRQAAQPGARAAGATDEEARRGPAPILCAGRQAGSDQAPALRPCPSDGVREISAALNALIADTFALYVKTKNFHWHVSGPHFRDYHLLLDEQGDELAASIDVLAERARKVGGTTIRSIGHIAKLQRIKDNDKNYVAAIDMLLELMNDNKAQVHHMRAAHEVADKHEDVATASLLENFIDEAEKRCWFLFEASREAERSGH